MGLWWVESYTNYDDVSLWNQCAHDQDELLLMRERECPKFHREDSFVLNAPVIYTMIVVVGG